MYPPSRRRHNGHMVSAERVRAIAVAEQAIHAHALARLLGTSRDIEVVAAEIMIDNARATIVRTRPDVVVVRTSDAMLHRFREVFDLQLEMPEIGFVVVLDNRAGGSARRAPFHRAMVVLPADFSLAALLSSVTTVGVDQLLVAI
jgi:hypothetical protein